MDAAEKAIQAVQRRWDEAPKATVTDLRDYRRMKWMRTHTRPMDDKPRPPHNPPPKAA